MKTLGERLRALRENRGVKLSSVMDFLDIDNLERYEKDERKPSTDIVSLLANYYGVSIDWIVTGEEYKFIGASPIISPLDIDEDNVDDTKLFITQSGAVIDFNSPSENVSKTPHERHILRSFRLLNTEQQRQLINISSVLQGELSVFSLGNTDNEIKHSAKEKPSLSIRPKLKAVKEKDVGMSDIPQVDEPEEEFVSKIVYDQRVSAGSGNIFDGNFSCEILSFPAGAVPDQADFGMIISGNSMEPDIKDKQTVWIRRCEELQNGQLGIFTLNGEALCKQYKIDHAKKKTYLVSLNPDYLTILIKKTDELKIIGKVLL